MVKDFIFWSIKPNLKKAFCLNFLSELSNKYLDLKKENQLLKERQEHEVAEKFKIKEKNQKVQNKVEGIINRLRSLEYTQQ